MRSFTAIGTGGNEFMQSMVQLVEGHVGPVHMECVACRLSGKGSYTSVRIGPVVVNDADQVIRDFCFILPQTIIFRCDNWLFTCR